MGADHRGGAGRGGDVSRKKQDVKAVEFVSEVRQVKTMADHTVNVTLNLPENCVQQAAWFMQHQGDMVKCVSVLEILTKLDNETVQSTKKKAKGSRAVVDSRRLRDRRDQSTGIEVQAAI